jgi:hypothetical protein
MWDGGASGSDVLTNRYTLYAIRFFHTASAALARGLFFTALPAGEPQPCQDAFPNTSSTS